MGVAMIATRAKRPPRALDHSTSLVFGVLALKLGFRVLLAAENVPLSPAAQEFFEKNVRPVLVESCYPCHSVQAGKTKGGLALDSRDALRQGGASGPALVPGDASASLLIKAVRYADKDLQMPPGDKKLSDERITALETWVQMGAPDPRTAVAAGPRAPSPNEAHAAHWAFQPVHSSPAPAVRLSRWVRNEIDNWVLIGMESRGLHPVVEVGPAALLRRLSYDLTGLPPAPEEVESFTQDHSDAAYHQWVEHWLASPQFGERWARAWLDVARYADTKGYLAGGEERRYPFSHTYRDYVIRAFNEDLPYDQFLLEQIAADRLTTGEDHRALAALGFLTLGRRFLNVQNDIIDDRMDVVVRGTQGLTIGCARCHDHKYDPISMKDYYALHGVFASTEEPAEKPLLGGTPSGPDYDQYREAVRKIEAEIEVFQEREMEKFADELRPQLGEYLLGARAAVLRKDAGDFDTWAGERKLNPTILRRWMAALDEARRKPDPLLAPWLAFAALPDGPWNGAALPSAQAGAVGESAAGWNPLLVQALATPPARLEEVAAHYSRLARETESAWKKSLEEARKANQALPVSLPDPAAEAWRRWLHVEGTPFNLPKAEARQLLARRLGEGSAPMRNRIEELNWTHPGAPARAMAVRDSSSPHNSRILLRGNPGNPGPEAPRRFLEVFNPTQPIGLTNGSGRLDLARAIASRDNPLTARVYVNRVWMQLFGEGLVRTPGDFGVRTPRPVQSGLLDHLAARFMERGWHTKDLVRHIVESSTYRQSSLPDPRQLARDPENQFLHYKPRKRLDFEATRDTLLAIAGRLDLRVGGLPIDILREPFATRRTVYAFIERQNLPGLFRTFDFANPDVSSPQRFHTTVPQQALFLMNSPFVQELARALAQRPEVVRESSPRQRAAAMMRQAWQRTARSEEIDLAARFLQETTARLHTARLANEPAQSDKSLDAWEEFAQVLLLSNETVFVD